jgi:hypothetical protein
MQEPPPPQNSTANTQRRDTVAEPVEVQRAVSAYKNTTAPTYEVEAVAGMLIVNFKVPHLFCNFFTFSFYNSVGKCKRKKN